SEPGSNPSKYVPFPASRSRSPETSDSGRLKSCDFSYRRVCEREKFDGRLYDTTQKTRIDDFSSMRGLCYAVKAFHIPALACYRCFPNCQRTKIAVKHGEFHKSPALSHDGTIFNIGT